MQICPRARFALSHWLLGRAARCGESDATCRTTPRGARSGVNAAWTKRKVTPRIARAKVQWQIVTTKWYPVWLPTHVCGQFATKCGNRTLQVRNFVRRTFRSLDSMTTCVTDEPLQKTGVRSPETTSRRNVEQVPITSSR